MRLSGLQRDVLSLYRQCLRAARAKPEVLIHSVKAVLTITYTNLQKQATRSHFKTFARSEMNKNIKIDKRDFAAIEFLLRKGRRQLEVYSAPGITDIH
ncbi:hypothetical protein PG994_012397 [Apiospora phragmitis]|uniref:Complex 1 LYR protein domain-containing protein n=1 Tax=Apiospora phragmitis TaxID=2905665 RepID=A0ABR1TVS3_9PEZI